mmetsp:Transcript_8434/g.18170  ORF Transcript_8434/g.18170 Transcript_8434/m.18170 type:complete len:87 (+) Transcript_8434:106-366(+)
MRENCIAASSHEPYYSCSTPTCTRPGQNFQSRLASLEKMQDCFRHAINTSPCLSLLFQLPHFFVISKAVPLLRYKRRKEKVLIIEE